MKTMRKLFFSALVLLFSSGFLSAAFASGTEVHKTFSWKYNINKDGSVVLDNYDCNITIHTWDKGETEFHLVVDAQTRSDEDAATLEKYLQDLKFSNSASSVTFRNSFWESRNTIMGKTTMKLEGGKNISITDYSMKGELWIPSGCKFELISKYSEINMEDFAGQLILNLYNDNLYAGNAGGKTEIEDKYSTIDFKEMKDIKADLYNSKLEATAMGKLKIESKYSKVTSAISGNLDIDSYNDKFSFTKTGDITFVAKYSDIKAESAGHIDLDCYEGTVILKDVKDVKITSKYADFQFVTAENITISSSYNDKLSATRLNSLKINESKYCFFKVDELRTAVTETDGYEDKFTILKTGSEFREMNINGKYVNISLGLPKSIDFRFKANITYPKLEMDESLFKPRIKVSDGSQLEYDAVRGTEKEGMPTIELNGYQMGLKIIEL